MSGAVRKRACIAGVACAVAVSAACATTAPPPARPGIHFDVELEGPLLDRDAQRAEIDAELTRLLASATNESILLPTRVVITRRTWEGSSSEGIYVDISSRLPDGTEVKTARAARAALPRKAAGDPGVGSLALVGLCPLFAPLLVPLAVIGAGACCFQLTQTAAEQGVASAKRDVKLRGVVADAVGAHASALHARLTPPPPPPPVLPLDAR